MNLHKIAGLLVDMGYKYETMQKQAEAYKVDEPCDTPQMKIYIPDELLLEKQKQEPNLTLDNCEYLYTGSAFYSGLLYFGGFMLHSSAVVMDGKAYLFTADSGTGKSTHTSLWQKAFGDRAEILNDDKPAIRIGEDGIFACGTPWSGKTDKNVNKIVPIGAIGFLERSQDNWIKRVQSGEVVGKLLKQTVRPPQMEEMDALLKYVDIVLSKVPVYSLGVNMTEDAAKMAYREMSK